MKHTFKNIPYTDRSAGDVVFALSDTKTPMTVENVEIDFVDCVWFDADNNLHRKSFKVDEVSL